MKLARQSCNDRLSAARTRVCPRSRETMIHARDALAMRRRSITWRRFVPSSSPSATHLRLRFGAAGPQTTPRFHQRDQFVPIMFELLVADAGDAAELLWSRRARRRDAVDRGVGHHDIGRPAP